MKKKLRSKGCIGFYFLLVWFNFPNYIFSQNLPNLGPELGTILKIVTVKEIRGVQNTVLNRSLYSLGWYLAIRGAWPRNKKIQGEFQISFQSNNFNDDLDTVTNKIQAREVDIHVLALISYKFGKSKWRPKIFAGALIDYDVINSIKYFRGSSISQSDNWNGSLDFKIHAGGGVITPIKGIQLEFRMALSLRSILNSGGAFGNKNTIKSSWKFTEFKVGVIWFIF